MILKFVGVSTSWSPIVGYGNIKTALNQDKGCIAELAIPLVRCIIPKSMPNGITDSVAQGEVYGRGLFIFHLEHR